MAVLHVIGLGTSLTLPSIAAQHALEHAELIIGAPRHLEALPRHNTPTEPYPSPFSELRSLIIEHEHQNVVLLASGDPLFFGIGGFLRRHFPNREMRFHANLSSMQTACSRLGLPWQNAQFLSLHGRPMQRLRACLHNQQTLILLTDNNNTPMLIAQHLNDCGFESSRIHVLECLDTTQERITACSVNELLNLPQEHFNPLNIVIVETSGKGGLLPESPGIDDHKLLADAEGRRMFTKRHVRLNALSMLQSQRGQIGWDIGAGCGGLSLEWARWHPHTQIHAVENNPVRLDCLHANQQRFGDHGNLHTYLGKAPKILTDLPAPERIFVGGNGGQLETILNTCWKRLKPQGRMVAVAVTLESRQQLLAFAHGKHSQWEEISISQSSNLGDQTTLKPQLPVLMLLVAKP